MTSTFFEDKPRQELMGSSAWDMCVVATLSPPVRGDHDGRMQGYETVDPREDCSCAKLL